MTGASAAQPKPEMPGQIVVVIGGSSGIGLETARSGGSSDRLTSPRSPCTS